VQRFVHPDEFAEYREAGYQMGLDYVESGPLVRSSYHSERHVFAGLRPQGMADGEGECNALVSGL
jgi:lipoic acid synthetase